MAFCDRQFEPNSVRTIIAVDIYVRGGREHSDALDTVKAIKVEKDLRLAQSIIVSGDFLRVGGICGIVIPARIERPYEELSRYGIFDKNFIAGGIRVCCGMCNDKVNRAEARNCKVRPILGKSDFGAGVVDGVMSIGNGGFECDRTYKVEKLKAGVGEAKGFGMGKAAITEFQCIDI